MPRLGQKYAIDVETITRSREEYQSEAYRASGWPAAPAVMVGEDVVAQGLEITEEKLEAAIRWHLGLTP